jgi:hypothetical protein
MEAERSLVWGLGRRGELRLLRLGLGYQAIKGEQGHAGSSLIH